MKDKKTPLPDLAVFDVDGVLVDSSRSYPEAIARSLLWAWTRVLGRIPDGEGFTEAHFAASKTHPAFNDDYDIAWALINCAAGSESELLSEALPTAAEWSALIAECPVDCMTEWARESFSEKVPREAVGRVCEEMYFGGDEFEAMGKELLYTTRRKGLWEEDGPLASFHWRELPVPAAIYTGRPLSELALALKVLRWEDFPLHLAITPDDGILKPSPEGLEVLCERTGRTSPLFLGDAESDRRSAQAFGRGAFAAIGNFIKGGVKNFETPGEALEYWGLWGQDFISPP